MIFHRVISGHPFHRIGLPASVLILSLPLLVLSDQSSQTPTPLTLGDETRTGSHSVLLSRPLTFEPNQGQTDEHVAFIARAQYYDLLLLKDRAQFNVRSYSGQATPESYPVSMMLVDANPHATLEGEHKVQGTTNYLLGNNRSHWRQGIPNYERARYGEIYPGIDLVYYGNQNSVEYDFVVSPGASPDDIRLELQGADSTALDREGNLTMRVGPETVTFESPKVYQEIEGKRHPIAGEFALLPDNQIGFTLGVYDPHLTLVIDPVLSYATYLGGTLEERIGAIAVDNDKNIYVVGSTRSLDFPTTDPAIGVGGNMDILVAKISSDGQSLLYATVMGGGRGDYGVDIDVDTEGNAYICGTSLSYDDDQTPDIDESFPIVLGYQTALAGNYGQDVVVAKLGTAGELLYSSYLGANNDQDEAKAIAVDQAGYMYVTGTTDPSMDWPRFPIRNAFQPDAGSYGIDGFVTKFYPELAGDASLIYSTYLGGQNTDTPNDIAVDSDGNAVIVGNTEAENFPLVDPLYSTKKGNTDAFVTKLTHTGSAAVFSTYIGGDANDYARKVKIDSDGYIYVAGSASEGFPTTPGVYDETGYAGVGGSTLFKIDPDGTRLEFSTFLRPYGPALDLAIDGAKDVLFAATYNANAVWHWVVNKMNSTGSRILYEDEITGLDFVNMGFYQSFAVDASGGAFFAFSPTRNDLPTITPLQADLKGSSDLYIARAGKDYIQLSRIYPDPTRDLGLPYTLRPGEERQFVFTVTYGLFASDLGTIEITIEDDTGNKLASHLIQNVPGGYWEYANRAFSKITVPDVEESDSLFVKAYLTPDGHVQPIDTAVIAYKIVVHKWTFMFYMNGDNDLEEDAIRDVLEMNAVGSNDSLAIVVLLDRIPGYHWGGLGEWTDSRYLVLLPDGKRNTRMMGELNMGDPQTLVNFVAWARTWFPAEHYALVLWDHGGGWMAQQASVLEKAESLPGFPLFPPGAVDGFESYLDAGVDDSDRDQLMSLEIKLALELLPKSDILWISTCLNAMVENAFQYRTAADYYVASQDRAPGRGWDNTSFFAPIKEHPDMTPEEVARWIVQSYGLEYSPDRVNITQSAVRMSKVDEVVNEVGYLAELLIEQPPWDEVDSALVNTHWFPPHHYRDLYHFALNLKEESADPDIIYQCDRIMGALYDCIVANYASKPEENAHGLSIFFPTTLAAYDVRYHKQGNIEFAEQTWWDEFLIMYLLRKKLPPGVEGPVIDTYEINDSFSQAYGPLLPAERYFSYIPYAGDRDFYFFTTGLPTSASIKLTSPQGINYDLKVMDANQQTLGSSTLDQEVDSLGIANLQPGTYYLEILTNDNFFELPYTLELAYEGSLSGQVPISYDDGEPSGGQYSEVAGEVLGSNLRTPSYPMKLDEVSFFISSTDGAATGGDGSFYVWVADYYGTKTDPFKVTPPGQSTTTSGATGSWFTVDCVDKDITLLTDFFVGIGYDGVNTPVLGTDPVDNGRTFLWDDSTDTWQALPLTAFVRATVQYLESPHHVAFTLPDTMYGLPGTSMEVPLLVSNMATSQIDSLELTLTYDPAILHLDSVSFGTTIGADWIINELDTTLSGRVNIAASAGTPLTSDETLLRLHLAIESGATPGDSTEINLERVFVNGGQILSSSQNGRVFVGSVSSVAGEVSIPPGQFALHQNYPNPFNPSTTLQYDVPQSSRVRLTMMDMLGRHVKTVVDRHHDSGRYQAVWDGTDDRTMPVAAGVYFCRMEAGTFVKVIKLALLK